MSRPVKHSLASRPPARGDLAAKALLGGESQPPAATVRGRSCPPFQAAGIPFVGAGQRTPPDGDVNPHDPETLGGPRRNEAAAKRKGMPLRVVVYHDDPP